VSDGKNPRDVKFELGIEIVDRFHGTGSGEAARGRFVARFRDGALPEDLPRLTIAVSAGGATLAFILREAQLVASTTAGYRMIEQGAVRIDGEKVGNRDLKLAPGAKHVLQVGKRGVAEVTLVASAAG
jgi:tyrosyl-tRNA synthetase